MICPSCGKEVDDAIASFCPQLWQIADTAELTSNSNSKSTPE